MKCTALISLVWNLGNENALATLVLKVSADVLIQTPDLIKAQRYLLGVLQKALLCMMHGCSCLHACVCCADGGLSSMPRSQKFTTMVLSMVARHMGHSFVFSMMLFAQRWHAHCRHILNTHQPKSIRDGEPEMACLQLSLLRT